MSAEIVPFFRCTCSGGAVPLEHCPAHTRAFALWLGSLAEAGAKVPGTNWTAEEFKWLGRPREDESV